MKFAKCVLSALFCIISIVILFVGRSPAQEASLVVNSGCNAASGTRFNLEPRLNAGQQNTESLDFLLNRVSSGVDLVVGAANDQTSGGRPNPRLDSFDAYYVHRQRTNCAANFEGALSTAAVNPSV